MGEGLTAQDATQRQLGGKGAAASWPKENLSREIFLVQRKQDGERGRVSFL